MISKVMVRVGMGEIRVSKSPEVLSCIGLGSCIGLVFYDRVFKVGGMAHIMMPRSERAKKSEDGLFNKAKYSDTAVEAMLKEMEKFGAREIHIKASIFGGANMFPELFHRDAFLNMGQRNSDSVKEELSKRNIQIFVEEIGGNLGRTVTLYTENGRLEMRTAYGEGKVWEEGGNHG